MSEFKKQKPLRDKSRKRKSVRKETGSTDDMQHHSTKPQKTFDKKRNVKPFSDKKPYKKERKPFDSKESDTKTHDKFKRDKLSNREAKPIDYKRKRFGDDKKPFKKDGSERKNYDKVSYKNKGSNPYDPKYKRSSEYKNRGSQNKQKATPTNDGLIRLNKYISNSGVCSRREADELIQSGAVTVNDKVVTEMGTKVSPDDVVKYGGQRLKSEKNIYILLNKPKDYITTADDPQHRKTVMILVERACKERIYPVGRLDRNTTGVLLFTNDGEIAKKLTHPKYHIHKIYNVVLSKPLTKADMVKISEGIEMDDGFIKVDEIAYTGNGLDKKQIGIELHSGKNRIVRRIFESLDYEVVKLDRVSFAGLTKKDLLRGKWRFLNPLEINFLKMIH